MKQHSLRLIRFLLVFVPASVCLAEANSANLLKNGDFEQGDHNWLVNSAFSPARVDVVTEDVSSGKQALRLVNDGKWSHFYQGSWPLDRRYYLSFWARGKTINKGGAETSVSAASVNIYKYGYVDEANKQLKFLRTVQLLGSQVLGSRWRRFKLSIPADKDPLVKKFALALGIRGDVILDDVVLTEIDTMRNVRRFYLSFDKGFDADQARGNCKAKVNGKVKLVEGRKGKAVMLSGGANLVFDAESNFDQDSGTLAMWIQPRWPEDDGRPHCFFEVPVGPEMFLDGGFLLSKGFSDITCPNLTYFYNSPGHYNISVSDFGFDPGKWIHLAASWSRSQRIMRLYRNGQLVSVRRFPTMTGRSSSKGRIMVLGARLGGEFAEKSDKGPFYGHLKRDLPETGGFSAESVIDEVMIFSRPLSSAEIRKLADSKEDKDTPLEIRPSPQFNSIKSLLKTPCRAFAKPLAGGPIDCYFIVPYLVAPRDVVELDQRFDMNYDATTVPDSWRFKWRRWVLSLYEGVKDEDKINEIVKKLSANPEVIVIGNFDYAKFPAPVQAKLYRTVQAGAGLVVVFPRNLPPMFQANPIDTSITRDLPLAGLPERLTDTVVRTYRCGKGRVAVIAWDKKPPKRHGDGSEGLAPSAVDGRWTRQYEHRYGYFLSVVAKAIRWTADRKPRATWNKLPADGLILSGAKMDVDFTWSASQQADAELDILIQDPLGGVEFKDTRNIAVQPGENSTAIALPHLKAGLHYLNLVLRIDGKVENWADVSLRVNRPEQIVELSTDREYYQRGAVLRGQVRLREKLVSPAELHVRTVDTNGRVYNQKTVPLGSGVDTVAFDLTMDRPTTLANYIEAELRRNGEILSYADTTVFVPKRDYVDFVSLIWCGLKNDGIGQLALRQLRNAGFNTVYHWSYAGDFHNDAMADLMPGQYCTRIFIQSGPGGIPRWNNIEDASIANPKVIKRLDKVVADALRSSAPLGPPLYSLGDENHGEQYLGTGPYGKKYFKTFLRKRYGTIEKLNSIYGTGYKSFNQVPRQTSGALPAAVDHRLAVDAEWAELHHYPARKICEKDPGARVGAEGSHAGDLELMLEGVRFWGAYAKPYDEILQRSLVSKDTLTSHWWGGYDLGAEDASDLWRWLIRGTANFQEYFSAAGGEGLLNSDFSYRPYFRKLLPELEEILGGVGVLLREATVVSDGDVAIHYSRLSKHAGGFSSLAQTHAISVSLFMALDELDQDCRFVTDRTMRQGKLMNPQAKVLFLPGLFAMTESEAKNIRGFVREGGVAVAILPPGVLDEYARRLPKGRLDDVFGATCQGQTSPLTLEDEVIAAKINGIDMSIQAVYTKAEGSLKATSAKILSRKGKTPLVLENRFGKGRAFLFNLDLSRYSKTMRKELVQTLLQVANIKPEYAMNGPSGARLSVSRLGDLTLLGVMLPRKNGRPSSVSWAEPAQVYNVRTGKDLGKVKTIDVPPSAQAGRIQLYALQAEPVRSLTLGGPDQIARGKTLRLSVTLDVGQVNPAGRIVRIDVIDPDGQTLTYYRDLVTLSAATGHTAIPFAFNDKPGRWRIQATDVATRVTGEKAVMLR